METGSFLRAKGLGVLKPDASRANMDLSDFQPMMEVWRSRCDYRGPQEKRKFKRASILRCPVFWSDLVGCFVTNRAQKTVFW